MSAPKRYKLIACEILFREMSFCAAKSKNIIDVEFLSKGLHDMGAQKMLALLQAEIDKVDIDKYEAILLGYGLCNNGIVGLRSSLPLVVPRAHDCITLLMGSKERYKEYHALNSATFFKSTGWVERDINPSDVKESITTQLGMNKTYEEYVEEFGEENAEFIMETMCNWTVNYNKYTYIDTNVGDFSEYKELVAQQANEKGWQYEELNGDIRLLMGLLNGEWDTKEYLVVPPQKSIKNTYDSEIIVVE